MIWLNKCLAKWNANRAKRRNVLGWIAVDQCGEEWTYNEKPYRMNPNQWNKGYWLTGNCERDSSMKLDDGTIYLMIGRTLTWKDEPVELVEGEDI